ncbi:RagB/SusD family nutrient uptake outer membrane protein [Epilithonimonas sp.]|uniref:RagB/SusD family nutrient uptake outer membrane protein n=1 Tax=Epilithonimonas sp. TaxID=2894511 RepID=UPI0035B3F656
MKKYTYIITLTALSFLTISCSEKDLLLDPPYSDEIESVDTENKMQQFLNGAYIYSSYSSAFGTQLVLFGDLLSDHLYVSNTNPQYLTTYNLNYNGQQNEFGFYRTLYKIINNCNIVINNTSVPVNSNVKRIKAEARILRGYAYFTLLNYYSPTPTSGINQEFGVPLVLGNYDASNQPARSTVDEVYNQVISDLTIGAADAVDIPSKKVQLSKAAAKLLLSKVYLTRRAPGDAQLALQFATEVVNLKNDPSSKFAPINALALSGNANSAKLYELYFSGTSDATSEDQPETIWELDLNVNTNRINGVGSNTSLPRLFNRSESSSRTMLFTKKFFDSFPHTDLPTLPNGTPQSLSPDVRRGNNKTTTTNLPGVPNAALSAGLLSTIGLPTTDNPVGAWTNKYPRFTDEGNYFRNIKILRFAEAQLNRIEALYLTGQVNQALTELNAFATSRGGSVYSGTGTELLNNILTERDKEFYGEGQRFLDLKRYSLPMVKSSNCVMNCNVPANDKLFVLPVDQDALNYNPNLKQYPGY